MLFLWLQAALTFLLQLLIPPPAELRTQRDPSARCPACGLRDGSIHFERVTKGLMPRLGDTEAQRDADRKALAEAWPALRHVCKVCGFAWYEAVVSKPEYPAA